MIISAKLIMLFADGAMNKPPNASSAIRSRLIPMRDFIELAIWRGTYPMET